MIRGDRYGAKALGGGLASLLLGVVVLCLPAERASAQVPPGCPATLGSADLIDHDLVTSFCELCDEGTVRIEIENPFGPAAGVGDLSELVVTEDLMASGLTYVPGSTQFFGVNVAAPPVVAPAVSGPNGSVLTWTLAPGFALPPIPGAADAGLIVQFGVRRHPSVGEEGLVGADRDISADVDLTPECAAPPARFTDSTGAEELPLQEPEPSIRKRGRNLDAGQGSGSYTDTVYGHENDDVIWRIEITNNGLAPLQDFVFSDALTPLPPNFDITWVCDSEGEATGAATGGATGDCVPYPGPTTSITGFDVRASFGGAANPYVVAAPGATRNYYLVGVVTSSCLNRTNTVFDVEWGCQSEPPAGGISATSAGDTAGDTAVLSTQSVESGLDIDVFLTGVNTAQPMGTNGRVRIRIRNQTGGTILHEDGIRIRDLLPPEYVIDTTFTPTFTMAPAYGNAYPGMIDTFAWTNPEPGTVPLPAPPSAVAPPLANTDLDFLLTSSTVHPDFADQFNMIRHGDEVNIIFRTILIDPQYYDLVADLDVRTEAPDSDPPGTDPTASFPISNHLEIWYEEFCTGNEHHLEFDDQSTARPEDLDVDIVGTELVFILTNTGDPLPLSVRLVNNGGHDARNYFAYVTFGEAMTVTSAPAGCTVTTNPTAMPVWQVPTGLPATASVYQCDRGTISPGEVELLNFQVVKNTAASFDDDLTFRADVIGEIELSNGVPLWFPAPTPRPDGILDRANDYTLDGIWARVIGYNLFKDQLGVCTENNPPPGTPDDQIQIGEECSFRIESGGWFGFRTPGFTYIAVQDIQLVDQLPDGQGYISSTDPLIESTAAIQGVSLNPPPAPLADAFFDWTFNTVVPAERITEKDHWFRANVTTRLLNDPIDTRAAPNVHAAPTSNVMVSTFEAVFFNESTGLEELYNLGPATVGYPREVHRRVDLVVTEPNLLLTKEVCNETRYGAGPACTNFVPLADDGDAFDTYVYRVTVQNEAASGGVTRAPAYDVTVTSVADASDQLFVAPLPGDALDNDADTLVDAGDAGGEGVITDNTVQNAVPARVIAAYTHSDALLKLDAGESAVLYYRVDPDDDVAPLQLLTNTVTAAYDSLEGASGAQTPPEGANGELGGARQYVSAPADAAIRIIPVEVTPKQIVRLANTPPIAPASPQPVSIGEEIEFELRTLIPVSQLRSFVVRDALPPGLSCSEAPAVDLGAPPYDAAGFVPGGVFTPTCTDTEVVWDFGDQTITQSPRADRRFDFRIRFIARVDNEAANQTGGVIRNGGTATAVTVSYLDEAANPVVLAIGEAAVIVAEPVIALTKAFSVASVDAADLPRVTVTATNTGNATAYNLRVLDDLAAVEHLVYAGAIAGASPPTADLTTFGANRPLFVWPAGFAIAPGETVSFSFAVQVDGAVEPLEVLDDTVQADFTSLPGTDTALNSTGQIGAAGSPTGMRNGALPNAGDALNDHEAEASASVSVPPISVDKAATGPAFVPEIGAHQSFELTIGLPEGTIQNLVVDDDLAVGSTSYVLAHDASFDITYEFVGITSINGLAPAEAAFTAFPADATSGTATWSIGTVVTESEDDLATQAISPAIRIRYFARVNNDLATNSGSTLQNTAAVTFSHGETGAPTTVTDGTPAIAAIESSFTGTKAVANVTPGKAATDPASFDDLLEYVITVPNGGNATAYDVNLVDSPPAEVTLDSGFTPTATIGGTPVAGFVPTPAGPPGGPLVWGRGNGDGSLDVPAGQSLVLTYRVIVTQPPTAGSVLSNGVLIDWTSLQAPSIYERTGDGCPAITPPDDYCIGPIIEPVPGEPPAAPDAVLKENTQATAAPGEVFRYRITIPQTPYPLPLYDVRIVDDLTTSGAGLRFVSVTKISGSGAWTPVNTGTDTSLVIEDPAVGIDVPAGEQIVVEIAVVLTDTPGNVSGVTFTNTADYTWNFFDEDDTSVRAGAPGTTPPMTIVEPELTLEKTGPAAMTLGTPGSFTLDVHNAGGGAAWNATILDQLPDGATGGTCDAAPTAVAAQVFLADGTTPVSGPLAAGTDFSAAFAGAPTCTLTLTILSPAGTIAPDQRLIVTYGARIDADTQNGATLTNVAGATEWFSAEPASADRRTYTEVITDGTVGVLDHEDAHTVTVALPAYLFEKTVMNVTTGADPAATATPGDTLRYRVRLENTGADPIAGVSVFDELDRLNAPPAFQAGTLQLVTVPPGADASNTSATGGSAGTGVLDVRNLSVAPGASVLIELEIMLAPVIANGTVVANQSQLQVAGVAFADSDDPVPNGPADPFVAGDEDPTQVVIQSAPDFLVEKISTDLTGDPAILLAGETLRYTLTVKNVGTANAADAVLQDAIPVNTQYVPGSTTRNGAPVPDGPGGTAPLAGGIPIYAPENPTPGAMRADASATPANVATVSFDVVVDPGVPDGTIIANQGFVSAVAGGVSDQPSDDPGTPIPDDPTRDVVGNSPLLFAPKQVALVIDAGLPGVVDPGDRLHYTITVFNTGAVAATGVVIQDAVPTNTTYVADSTTLNGLPVGQPDAGVSPLAAGFPISSSDLTPPLPAPGAGTLTPGAAAVVEFELDVNAGVPGGTLITNQAVVATAELPDLPTDGDGNPATGPEPTVVVVGDGQQLSITKQVAVVGGGPALAGATLEYVVRAVNIGAVPAYAVAITDDLDAATPGYLTLVPGSATLNGASTGVTVLGSVITADYSPLAPGGAIVLRFRAVIDPGLAMGTTVTNTGVVTWNTPPQTASASVSVQVGGMPGVGILNGSAWHDADFDDAFDLPGERPLQGWIVEAYRNGVLVQSAQTDTGGAYRISGLAPTGAGPDLYELRFRAPDAGSNSAALGVAVSPFTNGPQVIRDIAVPAGANLQGLNLPIDPNGVVYAAVGRTPVAGTTLTLLNAGGGTALPAACFDDPVQQGQVTRGDGFYKFDLNFSDPACASGGAYLIAVVPPGSGFVAGYSQIIPPTSGPTTAALSVPTCPGTPDDALPSPQYCEAQPSELAPPPSVPARSTGTSYHVHLTLAGSAAPGTSQIFNNHLPVDPVLTGAVTLIKTTPTVNVSRGQLVPYEIRFTNTFGADLSDLRIVDRVPPGFRYVEGSARIDGLAAEPTQAGRELTWTGVSVAATSDSSLLLLLAVGAGVGEGEYVNRAQVLDDLTGSPVSNEAFASVRVVPDPTFACTDVLGKVFDDANRNGVQDGGEGGLSGIRVVTARGLVATTDAHGRFHITCAAVPREERGSNFVLKLDDRTLPSGYRMSTRKMQVQRASYGKALRFHFGASLHRVVGLDVADAVFEPGTTRMRAQWKPRLGLLLAELDKEPSILRLSYVADLEAPGLVDERLDSIKQAIAEAWGSQDRYPLSVETEVFWRRGAPAERASSRLPEAAPDAAPPAAALPSVDAGPPLTDASPGSAVERHLPSDAPFMHWSQDPARLETESGDRLEQREVLSEEARTVKLTNLVPPIRFESGVADIPPSTIERLRDILDGMRHLRNVRLHLVGHADAEPLSPALSDIYGDNQGLSRERAGEVAEFVQAALALPPEAISFAWAGDEKPLASNATAEGRASNRRVEVEVWYDELDEKLAFEEVVIPADIKRVKVCRTETVCKMRYREGHERRARVRNLIAPLHYADEAVEVPEDFIRQVGQAFHNLRSKQNVTVKLVGFSDDSPLTGRAERIYGTHLAVSKAQAHRVALAIQDALDLPTAAVASDGRGATRPLASNDTERGRALNRRVEVEFWHDDPLQDLPDEPQRCPDASEAELVTKVYDPPWGRLAPLPVEDGEARVPPGYTDDLRRALADVAGRTHARLRVVGYTRNERLDRRTALVYGDDVGLSAARARRTMQAIQAELSLADAQVEHEGRGYVHSEDVVNTGFIQGDASQVVVQVVYDEPALEDDYEGVDITPITRELRAQDPLALNLMRITVDGQPIDDPSRSSADIQRCTDVALDRADIQFRFDNLESDPRLSVTSEPIAVPVDEGASAAPVRFRMYTNYPHFIERAEVRVFERGQSVEAEPVAVVPVGSDGLAHWQPKPDPLRAPVRELAYVLRVYGGEDRFDETAPQSLWMIHGQPANPPAGEGSGRSGLLAGYGESGPLARNIPLGSVGSVEVQGRGIPPEHSVWLAGQPVPVDADGNFVAQAVLPKGLHTVEVAVLDPAGNGELFLRDLAFEGSDWFYVGMADLTVAGDLAGASDALVGHDAPYDPDSMADGRLAFFLRGKFGEDWKLTASADTREESVENLFSNFLDKSPESLFRRIDPDYHYPAFGDDGTVEEAAPTSGKLFVKLDKNESHALWGNFDVGYLDNELAHVDRGLYGANLRYQSLAATSFGEERLVLDGFAAEPGTVPSREEFRGTGGSLYYLRRQDLLTGSERVRVEIRDKDSGLVTGVRHLQPTIDYDIDYLQGRILLTEPIGATVDDGMVVRSEGSAGDEAWLVVQYEYTPGFDEIDALATGGQGHYWFNDFLKLGLTANRNQGEGDTDSNLYAADLIARRSAASFLKLQAGRSEGLITSSLVSDDGGFRFFGASAPTLTEADANAWRADVSVGFADFIDGGRGELSVYMQDQDAGYSAPGMTSFTDTRLYGGAFATPLLGDDLQLTAQADRRIEQDGLQTTAQEIDLAYQLAEDWSLGAGVRNEDREDDSPLVPVTQEQGKRTDAAVRVGFDPKSRWSGYGFAQNTLAKSGDRENNGRYGVGGAYRVSERLLFDGEVSHGDLGPALKLGSSFQQSEETHRYWSYAYENERAYDGLHARRGNLISGVRTRLSDSSSVYMEDRYQHGDSATGLARAMGLTLAPSDRWSFGANWELGTLIDSRTYAETDRKAGGGRLAYGYEDLQISSGVEYRFDETEQLDGSWTDRTTWLFRNTLRYQATPSGRVVGKFNHSFSESSLGTFYDGGYTEGVLGYAYRPVKHDRVDALAKYTYFYNVPTTDQLSLEGTPVQYLQKSHIAALDVTYDLTRYLSLGGKYAYRLGQVSLDREDPEFFDNSAHLFILRTDYRFLKDWEGTVEGRMLDLPDLNDRKTGAVLTLHRYLGDHFKVGVGYNFTDFSDDLTDLSYDHHGLFFNLVGTM
jgi:uncharacterized repeat protein (TIGR01451 family)